MSIATFSKKPFRIGILIVVGVVASIAGWLFIFAGRTEPIAAKTAAGPDEFESKPITVKAVHPRKDKNFDITVDRPANVEAYYRTAIEAQVAGPVKWIKVAPGSPVKRGEVLLRVDVPEKVALLHEKQNDVIHRQREYDLALERKKATEQAVKTALANVELKKSLLEEAKALTKYRELQLRNFQGLLAKGSVEEIVRDEAVKNLDYAKAAEVGAVADRLKAEQEVEDARAAVKVCQAEAERAKQLIEVARSEEEFAAAIVGYAEVKAPFDGVVVSRHVDPGSFVQNASTGQPTTLITVERSDIVTVAMRVPDNYAPFINSGTEAIIELDSLPGLAIHGKVTRFAPSLVTAQNDRTMRVEVDLWNEAADKYQAFFSDKKNLGDLKDGPLPLVPAIAGKMRIATPTRLLPGMYGKMTLVLKTFAAVDLIPSTAIIRSGGRTFIYVVKDGKAHMVPVQMQVDDGTLAYVLLLGPKGEVLGTLPDSETVIISNQEELSEGQAVTPTLTDHFGTAAK